MGDPILNCLSGVCCPPEVRRRLLIKTLSEKFSLPSEKAAQIADWMLGTFDLLPHGTTTPLVSAIAELARGTPYKE